MIKIRSQGSVASRMVLLLLGFALIARGNQQPNDSPSQRKQALSFLRLYVFDYGVLHIADVGRFGLKPEEVATSDLSVPCFLVAHPKGALIWDTGAVPDAAWKTAGKDVT